MYIRLCIIHRLFVLYISLYTNQIGWLQISLHRLKSFFFFYEILNILKLDISFLKLKF